MHRFIFNIYLLSIILPFKTFSVFAGTTMRANESCESVSKIINFININISVFILVNILTND